MAGKKKVKATKAVAKTRGAGRPPGAKNKVKADVTPRAWALYRKTAFGLNDALLISTHVSRETSERALVLNAALNPSHTYYIEFGGSAEGPSDG